MFRKFLTVFALCALAVTAHPLMPIAKAQTLISQEQSEALSQAQVFAQYNSAFQTELAQVFDNSSFNAVIDAAFDDDVSWEEFVRLYNEWKPDHQARLKRVELYTHNIPELPSKEHLEQTTYNSLVVQRDSIPELYKEIKNLADDFESLFDAVVAGDTDRVEELSSLLQDASIAAIRSESRMIENSRIGMLEDGNPHYYLSGQSIHSNNLSIMDLELFYDESAMTREGRQPYIKQMKSEVKNMTDSDRRGREFLEAKRKSIEPLIKMAKTPEEKKVVEALSGLFSHLELEFDVELKVRDSFIKKIELYESDKAWVEIEAESIALDRLYSELINERIALYAQRSAFLDAFQ